MKMIFRRLRIIMVLAAFLSAVLATNRIPGEHNMLSDDNPKIRISSGSSDEPWSDLRIRYRKNPKKEPLKRHVIDDFPRYFLYLPDEVVETEVEYRIDNDRWSDRVILDKLYVSLVYGKTGLPTTDGKEPNKFVAAAGWNIQLDRKSNHCRWGGITCGARNQIISIRLFDTSNVQGTLPDDLHYLSDLAYLDLKGT